MRTLCCQKEHSAHRNPNLKPFVLLLSGYLVLIQTFKNLYLSPLGFLIKILSAVETNSVIAMQIKIGDQSHFDSDANKYKIFKYYVGKVFELILHTISVINLATKLNVFYTSYPSTLIQVQETRGCTHTRTVVVKLIIVSPPNSNLPPTWKFTPPGA